MKTLRHPCSFATTFFVLAGKELLVLGWGVVCTFNLSMFLTCIFLVISRHTSRQVAGRDDSRLMAHSEVETLFHEFGHAVHSLLSRTELQHVSGGCGCGGDSFGLQSGSPVGFAAWFISVLRWCAAVCLAASSAANSVCFASEWLWNGWASLGSLLLKERWLVIVFCTRVLDRDLSLLSTLHLSHFPCFSRCCCQALACRSTSAKSPPT